MDKKSIQEELRQSMLNKNELRTSVLRLILSSINYYEIEKGGAGYTATEDDVLSVIQKEAKQRRDSIKQFRAAERLDLAEKEEKELEIIKSYLPEQFTEEEIKNLVKQAISETGAVSITDMGKVMGNLSSKTKGKADGSVVSRIVKESLSNS